MKNMSFAQTIEQINSRTKTVTRRKGRKTLQPLIDKSNLPGRWCYVRCYVSANRGRFTYFGNCYQHFALAEYCNKLVFVCPNIEDRVLNVWVNTDDEGFDDLELICTIGLT
jgi:hypothetical protein